MATLGEVFKSFCAFGAGKDTGPAAMDNAKFAKMFRDLKLLDKNLTSTDVDITFNKVKAKTERKISFKQFKDALERLAKVKYPDDPEAFEKLKAKILEGKGPQTHSAVKGAAGSTVDRLTDTSKFTGTHKERFDDSGKGKGIEGRKDLPNQAGYVTGYKHEGTYDEGKDK